MSQISVGQAIEKVGEETNTRRQGRAGEDHVMMISRELGEVAGGGERRTMSDSASLNSISSIPSPRYLRVQTSGQRACHRIEEQRGKTDQ